MSVEKAIEESVDENEKFEVDIEYKEAFLLKQTKSTRVSYRYVLKRADEFEVKIGKKIYDFDIEDRDELLNVQYKNKNIWAFQAVLSPLKTYVDYCIDKRIVKHNQNRFATISTKSYKDFVNAQAKENSYIPLTDNREYQKGLVNYQDRAIIELLGLGVRGRTEKGNTLEELINFRVDDIQWTEKVIYLTSNDGEIRYLDVDDYTLDVLKKTIDSEYYIFGNGLKGKPNENGIYEKNEKGFQINPTEFVFRVPGKNKSGKADFQLFANRIQRIQGWLKRPYITTSSLYFSAILDEAKKIREEKGTITREDYIKINEKFKFGENGEIYFNKTKELVKMYLGDNKE